MTDENGNRCFSTRRELGLGPKGPASARDAAPGRRMLRPITENLEGRTVLSVGLDPTYGFGGVAELLVPPNTATTSYYESISSIGLQNGKVVAAGTMTAENSSSDSSSLNVWRLNTSTGRSTLPSAPVVPRQSRRPPAACLTPSTRSSRRRSWSSRAARSTSRRSSLRQPQAAMTSFWSPSSRQTALDSSFGTSGIELFSFGGNLTPSPDAC